MSIKSSAASAVSAVKSTVSNAADVVTDQTKKFAANKSVAATAGKIGLAVIVGAIAAAAMGIGTDSDE